MGSLKQIMYGVTDFARMRAENAWYLGNILRALFFVSSVVLAGVLFWTCR